MPKSEENLIPFKIYYYTTRLCIRVGLCRETFPILETKSKFEAIFLLLKGFAHGFTATAELSIVNVFLCHLVGIGHYLIFFAKVGN